MLEHLEDFAVLTRQQSASDADNQQVTQLCNIAWLGGIVDAEGSVGIYGTGKRALSPRLTITNTCYAMLDKTLAILDENGLAYYLKEDQRNTRNPTWVPRWQLIWAGLARPRRVLELVLPHLSTKRQEAELTLEFIQIRQAAGQGVYYGTREREIVEKVRQLKHTRHLRDYTRSTP